MSSFSNFLKQLPFSFDRFRQPENSVEALKSVGPDLAGITINVYELEVKGEGDGDEGGKVSSSHGSSSGSEVDSKKDELPVLPEDSELSKSSLLNELRYANIVIYCAKCNTEIPVCTMKYHLRRHQALQMLHYSAASPPRTVRSLLQRRNKKMENLVRKSFTQDGQLIRSIHKVNVAFELLKNEIEGDYDVSQIAPIGNWKGRKTHR